MAEEERIDEELTPSWVTESGDSTFHLATTILSAMGSGHKSKFTQLSDPICALGASGTDGVFSCPARNADQSLSKFVPTYTYEFNDENAPPAQALFGGLLTFPLGAYHSSELQYLFPGIDVFGLQVTLSPEQNTALGCDGELLDAVR